MDKTTCPHCKKAGFKNQSARDAHIRDVHKSRNARDDRDWLLKLFDAKVGGYGDPSWDEHS